jgi:riboflavin kinase/FMN adenylyltransferase
VDVIELRAGTTPQERTTVVGVGACDGVHLMHQACLSEIRRLAETRSLPSGLITFDSGRSATSRQLTSLDHRLELLDATGTVDVVWVLSKDLHDSPLSRLHDTLARIRPSLVAVPTSFRLGDPTAHGVGFEVLQSMARLVGFEVASLDQVLPGHGSVEELSYTTDHISELLYAGDVGQASRRLGRLYEMRGIVEHGDQRGRTLGFPTANLSIPDNLLIPCEGVYAGLALTNDGSAHQAAISLGRRPTFYEAGFELLEAHLLEFDDDIYDAPIRVLFVEKLRDQRRFNGPDALVAQLRDDIARTRAVNPLDTLRAFDISCRDSSCALSDTDGGMSGQ